MIDLSRLLHRVRRDSESGLSLVELLVAMMVFGILIAIVGTLYVTAQRTVTASSFTSKDAGVASNVMNELTAVLRYGTVLPDPTDPQSTISALVSATPTSVVLYSYARSGGNDPMTSPTPVMVGFYLNADGTMTEKRWNFSGSTPPNAATASSVAPNKTIALGGPLIAPTTNLSPAGACQDPNATTAPAPYSTASASAVPPLFVFCNSNAPVAFASGAIPTASLKDIDSVAIDISMNTGASQGGRSVVLAGTIDLQNLGGSEGS